MKRTIREFGKCTNCKGQGYVVREIEECNEETRKAKEVTDLFIPIPAIKQCNTCNGSGETLIKETIEESDDMKEFIEKKCGWELVEGKEKKVSCVPRSFFGVVQCICSDCNQF